MANGDNFLVWELSEPRVSRPPKITNLYLISAMQIVHHNHEPLFLTMASRLHSKQALPAYKPT